MGIFSSISTVFIVFWWMSRINVLSADKTDKFVYGCLLEVDEKVAHNHADTWSISIYWEFILSFLSVERIFLLLYTSSKYSRLLMVQTFFGRVKH